MKKLLIPMFVILFCAQLEAQVNKTTNSQSLCAVASKCTTIAKAFKQYLTIGQGSLTSSTALSEQVRTQLPDIKTQVDSNLYSRISDFVKMQQEGLDNLANIKSNQMNATLWGTIFEAKAKYIKEHICPK
jgi:hypothetical protein